MGRGQKTMTFVRMEGKYMAGKKRVFSGSRSMEEGCLSNLSLTKVSVSIIIHILKPPALAC